MAVAHTGALGNSKTGSPLHPIVLGGLLAGICDITFAFVYYGLRGAKPVPILQSIASGLLGRDAFRGGTGTAVLGGFLHFFIAFSAAAIYYLASKRFRALAERPFLWGPLYGIAVHLFMSFVVVPLSAFPNPQNNAQALLIGGLAHIFFVGLPIALAVRRYSR